MNIASCVFLLRRCIAAKCVLDGMKIHHISVCNGHEQELIVGNFLAHFYGNCGSLENANAVLHHMRERNIFSRTILIKVYLENGFHYEGGLEFQQMLHEGMIPNRVSIITLISGCASQGSLDHARRLHTFVIASGFSADIVVDSALTNMYCKCGSLEDSRRVFDWMDERNEISWNAIISSHVSILQWNAALKLFNDMHLEGFFPTRVTYVTVLGLFGGDPSVHLVNSCKLIHAYASGRGMDSDVVVGTALVNVYARLGSLKDAIMAFEAIFEPNTMSWNAIIRAYHHFGVADGVLILFQRMRLEGNIPDSFTFSLVLSALGFQKIACQALQIHVLICNCEYSSVLMVENALINMYGKCGRLKDAWVLFAIMSSRDVVTWNALLGACIQYEQVDVALQLLQQMLCEGILPDQVSYSLAVTACTSAEALDTGKTFHVVITERRFSLDCFFVTCLLNMYGKSGDLENAQKIHDGSDRCNIISWTAMISVCIQQGLWAEAFQLHKQLQLECMIPTDVTLINMLDLCASESRMLEGKRLHAACYMLVDEMIPGHISVRNALINMHIKCGNMEEALSIFKSMHVRDLVTWTVFFTGLLQFGHGQEIYGLWEEMLLEDIVPNKVTFINVLEACSHMGLVEDGYYYFAMMSNEYSITPAVEHYNCMVDLLSRAGQLDKAEALIQEMTFYSRAPMWLTLLSACRNHSNLELAKKAVCNLRVLEPESNVPDALLANTYAKDGQWKDVSNIRNFKGRNPLHLNPCNNQISSSMDRLQFINNL